MLSYQNKDGHAWSRPTFFWYDTDFSKIIWKIFLKKSKKTMHEPVLLLVLKRLETLGTFFVWRCQFVYFRNVAALTNVLSNLDIMFHLDQTMQRRSKHGIVFLVWLVLHRPNNSYAKANYSSAWYLGCNIFLGTMSDRIFEYCHIVALKNHWAHLGTLGCCLL